MTNRVSVVSAHIATYGERAVDVFYVQDLDGRKVETDKQIGALEAGLLSAARQTRADPASQRKNQAAPTKKKRA